MNFKDEYLLASLLFVLLFGHSHCQNSLCPDESELLPYCSCLGYSDITLDCSNADSESHLELIFTTAFFPTLNIYELFIQSNKDLKYLTRNVFGVVMFQRVHFHDVAIEYIDESAFLNSIHSLTTWTMNYCNLKDGYFPFYSLNLFTNLSVLDFFDAGEFKIFPKIASPFLTSVRFDHCQIQFIPLMVLDELPNLMSLTLNNNNISSLPTEVFDNNSKLTILRISYNNLQSIDVGTFSNILNLTEVYLNSNNLSHIEIELLTLVCSMLNGGFLDLVTVESSHHIFQLLNFISLALYMLEKLRNSITRLFDNNTLLTSIWLSFNNIQKIETGTFKNLPNLAEIFLHYNNMTDVEVDAFYNLPSLTSLYLNYNTLDHLYSLGNLTSLHTLCIYDNDIGFLKNDLLIGCSKLKSFEASSMNLSVIEAGTFDLSPKYGYIWLHENNLMSLDESWLGSALRNQNQVYLLNNPFECDCDAAWLFNDTILMSNLTAECKNGSTVQELNPQYFINNC